jgi:hypothetical protein
VRLLAAFVRYPEVLYLRWRRVLLVTNITANLNMRGFAFLHQVQGVYLHPFQQVSLVPLLCKIVETKANDTLEV